MADTLRSPLLLGAILAAGLQAGTYYVWACAVMPALARADDRTFVAAITHVNQTIVNPVFMASFLGAPVLAGAAVATSAPAARPWTIAGLALTLATVLVTVAGNVPLNNALGASAADPTPARAAFETAWVRWNILRTVTSTAALAALGWAALRT